MLTSFRHYYTLLHITIHYSALLYITIHYCTLLYVTIHYYTLLYITVHYYILLCIIWNQGGNALKFPQITKVYFERMSVRLGARWCILMPVADHNMAETCSTQYEVNTSKLLCLATVYNLLPGTNPAFRAVNKPKRKSANTAHIFYANKIPAITNICVYVCVCVCVWCLMCVCACVVCGVCAWCVWCMCVCVCVCDQYRSDSETIVTSYDCSITCH